MLPGLSLTVSEDIHFCSFLEKLDKDIKNNTVGSLSSYLSSSCLRTCHNLIKIKLLGNDCSVNDKNPAIRKMLLHSLYKKDIGYYISDPCHFVRAKAIEMSKPRIELLEHLNDLCVDVRLAVLDKLGDFKFLKRLNRSEQQSIFVEICERINDIEVSVRQKVSAVLRNFTLISTEQIHNMLTKTDEHMKIKLGTFVHGLEDENEVVRINIICSMCKLIKTDKTANVVFDFLLDALNDVIEKVKETAGMNIYEMAKMFKVNVNSEMVDMIFFNFEEKNEDVKMHLFNVIPHLVFDNETLRHTFVKFRKLLDKNIDKERIFYCIKKLTCENAKYFRDYIDQNEVFNRPKEPPLNNNKHYMHVIVLAEVLKKGYDVKYKMYLEKHLFYYRMKDAQIYLRMDNTENVECISEIETVKKQRLESKKDLKYYICKFLENIGDGDKSILYYKNLFRSQFAKTPLDIFYVKLFKAISRVIRFNEYSLYERLKVIYNFDVEIGDLHAYVFALDEVTENAFCISCLPRINKKFMLPLQLRVKVYYTREVSGAFIKIYNKDFTKYYGLRKDSLIYLYEEAKSISVCIVKKLDTNDILLTKSHKIIIE